MANQLRPNGDGSVTASLLRELANAYEKHSPFSGNLTDKHGNVVGHAKVEE